MINPYSETTERSPPGSHHPGASWVRTTEVTVHPSKVMAQVASMHAVHNNVFGVSGVRRSLTQAQVSGNVIEIAIHTHIENGRVQRSTLYPAPRSHPQHPEIVHKPTIAGVEN